MSNPRLYRTNRRQRQRPWPVNIVPPPPPAPPGNVLLSLNVITGLLPVVLVLTVEGPVTSVLIGGLAATGLIQIGNLVTVLTPILGIGIYTVVVSGPGGTTTLPNAIQIKLL